MIIHAKIRTFHTLSMDISDEVMETETLEGLRKIIYNQHERNIAICAELGKPTGGAMTIVQCNHQPLEYVSKHRQHFPPPHPTSQLKQEEKPE